MTGYEIAGRSSDQTLIKSFLKNLYPLLVWLLLFGAWQVIATRPRPVTFLKTSEGAHYHGTFPPSSVPGSSHPFLTVSALVRPEASRALVTRE